MVRYEWLSQSVGKWVSDGMALDLKIYRFSKNLPHEGGAGVEPESYGWSAFQEH